MKKRLLILLPFLAALALNLSPLPQKLMESWWLVNQGHRGAKPARVVEGLARVLEWQPWRTDLRRESAALSFQLEDWAAVIQTYDQINSTEPLLADDLYRLGAAFKQSGQLDMAKNTWQALVHSGQGDLIVYRDLTALQRSQGDFDGQESNLRLWLARDPQNADALFELAVLESLHDLRKAQADLRKAAELEQTVNLRREQFQRAVVAALTVMDKSGQYLVLGKGLGNIGYWDLAEKAFSQAVAYDETSAESWAFWGESKQQLGKNGQREIEAANRLNAQSIQVQVLTALYWRRQGRPDVANTFMHRVALSEPEQPMWVLELGNILTEMGDMIAALSYYQQATEMDPQNNLYWKTLARFCIENEVDIRGTGIPAARQALLISPDDSESLGLAGWAFLKLNDLVSAERFLQQSILKNPDNGLAHLHLSQLYLQSGEFEKAYPHLQMARDLEGDQKSAGILAMRLLERYFGQK